MVDASENHDGVARMGGFDRLLDRFARTTCPLGFAEAKPTDTSSDKATNTANVVIKTMRLISATSL
jgi:hypothetical protein